MHVKWGDGGHYGPLGHQQVIYLLCCFITEPSTVACDFTSSPTEVATTVHHNSEQQIRGIYSGSDAYKWNVSYFVSHSALPYIKAGANRCEQYIWFYDCYMDLPLKSYLLTSNGEREPYLIPPFGELNCPCLSKEGICDEHGITG